MAAVTVATVAKKALEVLASNKKGRHFLGYVIGIAVFILLIPVIVLVGLFGWMAGDGGTAIDMNAARQGAVQGIGSYYAAYEEPLAQIETTFEAAGLTEQDVKKAQFIFVSMLTDHSEDTGFYENYAKCFTDTSGKYNVYALIENTFGVTFSTDDKLRLDSTYGETPIRLTGDNTG